MNINDMYRELSDEAKARYREWARNNHKPGDDITSTLHPIVKDECRLMDEEFAGSKVAKVLKVDFLEHRKNNECAGCGEPVMEDDLLCESCQARDDKHRDEETR